MRCRHKNAAHDSQPTVREILMRYLIPIFNLPILLCSAWYPMLTCISRSTAGPLKNLVGVPFSLATVQRTARGINERASIGRPPAMSQLSFQSTQRIVTHELSTQRTAPWLLPSEEASPRFLTAVTLLSPTQCCDTVPQNSWLRDNHSSPFPSICKDGADSPSWPPWDEQLLLDR